MNSRFLVQLNHPAHFHLFRNTIDALKNKGHDVLITVKNKDILTQLLDQYGYEYELISSTYRKNNPLSIIANIIKRDLRLLSLAKKFKPDLLFGTSPEIGHVGRVLRIPSVFFGEDDINLSKTMILGAWSCYPFFSSILSPIGCFNGRWNRKTVFYSGLQKLAYLHPKVFKPNRNKVNIPEGSKYFILRLSNLKAYHDRNKQGITLGLLQTLIDLLSGQGEVIITSEREKVEELEAYYFKGNPLDIHHYMAFADLIIADSQSMIVESAVLGVPNIRFNNFVGKITVLEELSMKYGLTKGISSDRPAQLFEHVNYLLSDNYIRDEWQNKQKKMLLDKINVSSFYTWFIENYPASVRIMQENPEYQNRFK